MATKYLDSNGLLYFWQKIKSTFALATHTHSEYVPTSRKVNNKALSADISLTASDVGALPESTTIPTAGTGSSYPTMDGTRALGSQAGYARVDHVHPSDTSRVPTTRKVNGKALSADVILSAEDIGYDDTSTPGYGEGDVQAVLEKIPTMFVEKETGKGLSTNDYTTAEKTKLAGIATGAEVNVQADWNVTNTSSDAYIKNKPTIPADKVFIAEYGVTTRADLVSAINSKKAIFVVYISDVVPVMAQNDSSGSHVYLYGISGTRTIRLYDVSSEKTWSYTEYRSAGVYSPEFTGTPTAPTATAGTNTTQIATTAFVQNAVSTAVTGAVAYQGIAPTSFAPTNYKAGWYWIVGTAGTYCGQVCEAGDMIFCKTGASTYSASDFDVVQTNLDITSITNADIDTIVAS